MQNRYFGDVGDFVKYGLLRKASAYVDRLGILWCLAKDELHNNDGKHTTYLIKDTQGAYRACDPKLFDSLQDLLVDENGNIINRNRDVCQMESLGILPANTIYYKAVMPVGSDCKLREKDRGFWFERALDALRECDLVFCDPDNGIEVPSKGKRTKDHFKYIYWDELIQLWSWGKSLIIYQHMHRGSSHVSQAKERQLDISGKIKTDLVVSLRSCRGTVRTFFLVPQPHHRECFKEIYDAMTSGMWSLHIKQWEK